MFLATAADRSTSVPSTSADHWDYHARQWAHVGPPLRPQPEDIATVEQLCRDNGSSPSRTALLLGVTPELACMRWPSGTRLLAVDRNHAMVTHVWPHAMGMTDAAAVVGDWMKLPVDDNRITWVVGDGCYTLLVGESAYRRFSEEIHRVLRPEGRFLMRFFVRPTQPESPETVIRELRRGRIGNFHIFKWRLAMSLHGSFEVGVRVTDVWKTWNALGVEASALAQMTGWPVAEIETIYAYRESPARYSFPTLAEVRAALNTQYCELTCHFPSYELGERCPTFLWAPRK